MFIFIWLFQLSESLVKLITGSEGFNTTTQQDGMVVMLNYSLRVSTSHCVCPAAYKRKTTITGNLVFIYKCSKRGLFCIGWIPQLPVIVYWLF